MLKIIRWAQSGNVKEEEEEEKVWGHDGEGERRE